MRLALISLVIASMSMFPAVASDLSFFAGYGSPESFRVSFDSIFFDIDPADYGVLGVRFEYTFGRIFGIENSLAYTSEGVTLPLAGSQNGLYYTGNFVINAPLGKVVPNATIGAGFFHRFGQAFPQLDDSFLVNYGGGVKFREVVGRIGFRIDYRRLYFEDIAGASTNSNEITGGLMITF